MLKDADDRRYEDIDLDRCRDYVTLLNFRNWEKLGERYMTEQIHVHNKTMIVDDRFSIVGSANSLVAEVEPQSEGASNKFQTALFDTADSHKVPV